MKPAPKKLSKRIGTPNEGPNQNFKTQGRGFEDDRYSLSDSTTGRFRDKKNKIRTSDRE